MMASSPPVFEYVAIKVEEEYVEEFAEDIKLQSRAKKTDLHRAAAPIKIADEQMTDAAILNEGLRLIDLNFRNMSKLETLQWFARRKLIRNSYECSECDANMSLVKRADRTDGYQWNCNLCLTRKTVRDASFFSLSRLPLGQLIIIIYCWARDYPQYLIAYEAGVSAQHTVIDWCSFCREVCETDLENNPTVIGGFDEEGQPKVVEIIESKFFHRKYHRGQWSAGHWVFGGIERLSHKCFLVEVPDRTKPTLSAVIQRYILPGTVIVSDGFVSNKQITDIGGGIYEHDVIVNQENVALPGLGNVHILGVQSLRMRAKRKLRRQSGTSEAHFPSYVHEFIWRNSVPKAIQFEQFLVCVARQYTWD